MYQLIQRVPATLAFMAHACQMVQMASLARAIRDIQVYINDAAMDVSGGEREMGNTSVNSLVNRNALFLTHGGRIDGEHGINSCFASAIAKYRECGLQGDVLFFTYMRR